VHASIRLLNRWPNNNGCLSLESCANLGVHMRHLLALLTTSMLVLHSQVASMQL
jgi:hypothetical protein